MQIHKNYNLSKLNTFGISVNAKFFVEIHNETDVKELFKMEEFSARGGSAFGEKKLFLGGGSHVLFTKDFDGLVILNKLKGIEILNEDLESVTIRCMGGEIWHDLVTFSVKRGLWGIENLALIPGTVGAAPMQNIGAYGAELQNVLQNVEAFDLTTGEKRIFKREECKLGYRDSIFKNELKDKYFITAVILTLSKLENKNITYKILEEYLKKNEIEIKGPKDISDAVAAIRKNKLPDPAIIPNAGSFFKNVFIGKEELRKLQKNFPQIPYFEEDGMVKVPAGWLIEHCGPRDGTSWRGYRLGNVGVHEKQALVLVNYGGATGEEISLFADKIISDVKEKFGLKLVPEVNLI